LSSQKFLFDERHVLFGKLRPNLAKVARPGFSGICSTDILPLKPLAEIDRDYLAHFLLTREAVAWATSRTSGANLPRLSPSVLGTMQVPLPPLPEQRRIASILDNAELVFSARQRSIALVKELPNALFSRAFGGSSQKLEKVRLGDLFRVSGGKRLPKGEPYADAPTNHPYLRVVDMKGGSFSRDGLKFLRPETQAVIANYTVQTNDLVISIAGTIGLVAGVPVALDGSNLTENAARLRPLPGVDVNSEFIRAQLSSREVQDQIGRATGRVTIGKLALFRIENLMINVPPLDAQTKIALELTEAQAHRRLLASHLATTTEIADSLRERAFKGEL
jgi:type I restriction enzyme S subunit